MSASGFTPVQLYRSTTAAAVPLAANLAAGELAINLTDEKLYFENASGVVKVLADSTYVGTVTSVAASGGTTGLTFTGSPITSSGTLTLSGTLAATNGGTGQSSYAIGDLLFASTTTALSKLADVATGNALISGGVGVAPLYGKIGLTTHVSGTLAVGNGGTGATTLTANGVLVGDGTSAVSATAVGTTGQVLVGNTGAAPTWATLTSTAVTSFSAGTTGLTPSTATQGAITLAGTLAVANGGTGVTTSTGTGSVVLSASPSFTGTVNFGPSIITGTGLSTGDAQLELGANRSGSGLAYLDLHSIAGGDFQGRLIRYAGANGGMDLVQTGTGGMGISNEGNSDISFKTNAIERMRIDASGNVGIGTSGPSYRLDVASGDTTASIGYAIRIRSNATATAAAVQFTNSGASSQTGLVTCTDTGTMTIQSDGASSLLAFRTNGTERMRIASNGFVGVGTSTDNGVDKLTVAGIVGSYISGRAGFHLYNGGATAEWFIGQPSASSHNLTFSKLVSGTYTDYVAIDSTGNVGIGNTSPTVTLDVTGGIKTSRTAVTAPATSDGNIFSGTYTPTLTNSTNVDISNSTAYTCQYMRVGDVVTVSGKVSIAVIGSGITRLNMTLPVSSNFSAEENCAGTAQVSYNGVSTNLAAQIKADTTNDRAQILYFGNVTGAAQDFFFTFTYRII